MNEELLTFSQVIERTNTPHLLIGNGFSMAYDPSRFSFTTLLESAVQENIIQENSHVYKVFQRLETADFESVMKILDETEKVVDVYEGDENLKQEIAEDATNLKGYLVAIITNNHPAKSTDIPVEKKSACINFLKQFKKIYTLNYDLLLYWATMQDPSSNFTDGFGNTEDSEHEGYVVYKNQGSFNVHYLHGALHFFDAGDEIIKKTFSNSGIELVTQVRQSLDSGVYPVFISEGNSQQKKAKIIHNPYLNHCYKSLCAIGNHKKRENRIEGEIVILGTALKHNDSHILEAILNNNIKDIYLGVSSLEAANEIKSKVEEFNKGRDSGMKKNLYLYNHRTANIWNQHE